MGRKHPNTIPGPAAPPVAPALTLGRPGAPVTIVEFGDYQCTNCGAFARDTEPTLVREYVDTGVVRLVWRDFPWVDAQSVAAAVAARAAGMQGKFWAYHDYLFAHQSPDEHSGLVTGAYLRSVARRLGLNIALFNREVAGPALAAAVRAGAVLTVAAASGQPARGAALLAVYAAGMTAPLFGLAAAWDRLRIGQRRWLRGTGVRVGPLRLHTHSVISGLIFTGLGVVFLRYQGTAGLTGLLAPPGLAGWDNRLQDAITAAQAHVPDLVLLAAAAAVVIAVTAWRLRRSRHPAQAGPPQSAGQPVPAAPGTGEPADREPAISEPAGRDPARGR